ncbi:signal transducing kinase of the PAK [Linnemannia zychae]|nr:signal transducing kinase of the PAK [Linnemannia zychae]
MAKDATTTDSSAIATVTPPSSPCAPPTVGNFVTPPIVVIESGSETTNDKRDNHDYFQKNAHSDTSGSTCSTCSTSESATASDSSDSDSGSRAATSSGSRSRDSSSYSSGDDSSADVDDESADEECKSDHDEHQDDDKEDAWEDPKPILVTDLDSYYYEYELGEGEFGRVFMALDSNLKEVAIKQVKDKGRDLVENEKRAMHDVDHENVVRLLDESIQDRVQYFVLEHCGKGNLSDLVSARGKLIELEVASLGRQILEGLGHLHSKGYLHRDIKPDNILFGIDDGEIVPKLADLGFAHPHKEKEARGIWGTKDYIAPEVLIKRPHTPSMDIWSVGALLYFMLFGQEPSLKKISKILNTNKEVVRVDECGTKLSKKARNVLVGALALNPKNRLSLEDLLEMPFFEIPENAPTLTSAVYYHITGKGPMPPVSMTSTPTSTANAIHRLEKRGQASSTPLTGDKSTRDCKKRRNQ